jgi:hypothetical protein
MFKDFFVINDIFDDPFSVVEKAKQLDYYVSSDCLDRVNDYEHLNLRKGHLNVPDFLTGYWKGFRTNLLHKIDEKFFADLMNQIFNKALNVHPVRYDYNVMAQFHIIPNGLKFDDSWVHSDNAFFAGVVYLNKEPESNSGTIIEIDGKQQTVENKFNRLVMYNGKLKHAPQDCFYGDVEDRLVLTFFLQQLKITYNI